MSRLRRTILVLSSRKSGQHQALEEHWLAERLAYMYTPTTGRLLLKYLNVRRLTAVLGIGRRTTVLTVDK